MKTILPVLLLLVAGSAFAADPISLQLISPDALNDALQMDWRVVVTNDSATDAPSVFLMFETFQGHGVVHAPEGCVLRFNYECTVAVPAHASRELVFTTVANQQYGRFEVYTQSSSPLTVERDAVIFGRPYTVTNIDDSGPGSLRQAILDMNRDCTSWFDPCSIAFDISEPATIRPTSALPQITAPVFSIYGRSQTRAHGEANPVRLDGSDLMDGHGLSIRATWADLRDLEIERFPRNGIDSAAFTTIRRCDVSRNRARGIELYEQNSVVTDNVLSDNAHAGGFFWIDGAIDVRRNRVTGNGASGLFFHNTVAFGYRFADVRDNLIENNAHAGIGLTAFASGNFARNVMVGNHNGAIDIGLDGPTLESKSGNPGLGGIIGAPVITSAKFENGVTTIEGRVGARSGALVLNDAIYVYANTREASDAEELIGTLDRATTAGTLTLRVDRDLRGRWITASEYSTWIYDFDHAAQGTSEVGPPRIVE